MIQSARPGGNGPPHNPDLRELIENKRRWSARSNKEDAKRGFHGWNERGYLPHRDEPGLTQFVTFRLTDSFPAALRSEWEYLLKIENDLERQAQLEAYLDKGRGECHLKRPKIAGVVESTLRFFDGHRYALLAWVVMPNHVHVLFKVADTPMRKIVESWKKRTGFKANRLLFRSGAFWQADYWDTHMRNAAHELETRQYIENNPVKAGLTPDPRKWPWSSARFRDEYEVLKLT